MNMKVLEKNVINIWGHKGREWFKNLPKIIAELSEHWQLREVMPVNNMRYNYVAFAKQNHSTPVVLKLSCDKALITNEFHALKQFNGVGAIQVIDRHVNHNALLLEQAIPGSLLKANHLNNVEDTIKIYAYVVKALASATKLNTEYTHVKKWCQAIDKIHDQRIGHEYINKAKELRAYLLSSSDKKYLCHGDLHLENIIYHNKKWLSLDPKGILGEMAFEAAAFDLVDKSEWTEPKIIPNKINQRLSLLANNLEIAEDRLL